MGKIEKMKKNDIINRIISIIKLNKNIYKVK